MTNRESFSVAMCTYNGEKYLPEQLASIAVQSRQPVELVVCDDGSTDRTLEILETFCSEARFPIRIFSNNERLGSTKNFEKAIGLCIGDNIALADQDDVWLESKLERLGQVLEGSNSIGAVFSDAVVVDATLRPLGYRLWETRWFAQRDQQRLNTGQGFEILLQRNVVTGATLAIRSALRRFVLPIPRFWVHDGWIALIAAAHSGIVAVNEPLISYRKHEQQQIGTTRLRLREKISLVLGSESHVSGAAPQHRPTAEQYIEVDKHLRSIPADACANKKARLRRLNEKIQHLAVRETLPAEFHERSAAVLRELSRGRYHAYSAGWDSALWDLLRGSRGRRTTLT